MLLSELCLTLVAGGVDGIGQGDVKVGTSVFKGLRVRLFHLPSDGSHGVFKCKSVLLFHLPSDGCHCVFECDSVFLFQFLNSRGDLGYIASVHRKDECNEHHHGVTQ